MIRTTIALVSLVSITPGLSAQGPTSRTDSLRRDSTTVRPESNRPATAKAGWRHILLSAFSSGVYDSNIDRDLTDVQPSRGFVFGGAARYSTTQVRPRFAAGYEIAKHSYSHNDQFDRVSHHFNAVYAQSLNRALIFETIADVGIRGSSEDRDVGNQYVVIPRLSYRLPTDQRIRLYGAYRVRRYDVDQGRNAFNRYAGLEIRDEADDGGRWETGFRYETNSARSVRRSYTRRTYHTGYSRTIRNNDDVFAELKYLSQRYDKRSIEVEDEDVPRHDHRISPTVQWVHRFGSGFSMIANYDFEHRMSNDPSNGYRDHIFTLTGRVDW